MRPALLAGARKLRRTFSRDLVLEMVSGHAGLARYALERQQPAHIRGSEHEFTRLVGFPVRRGCAAVFAGHVRGHFVAKVPAFFQKRQVRQGLGYRRFRGKKLFQLTQNMGTNALPHGFLQKHALALALSVHNISDRCVFIHNIPPPTASPPRVVPLAYQSSLMVRRTFSPYHKSTSALCETRLCYGVGMSSKSGRSGQNIVRKL